MSRNEAEIRTKLPELLWLGPRWFDPVARELKEADGTTIDLRRQSIDVLAYLAERQSRIVTKEELVSDIWSDVAVTDDSLVQCIGDIRRALGPEGRDCIQTVRRRGYRLVPTGGQPEVEGPSLSYSTRKNPLSGALVFGAILGLAAFVGFDQLDDRVGPEEANAPNPPVIAVLPFSNHEEDPEQQYFVDGLTEDIATDLSRVSGLSMISSASTFAIRDSEGTPIELARDLGADYVLTGSTRRDKRRVRVTATLTEVSTGRSIWADRYDRDIGGIFELQDDVSKAVASSLAIRMTNDELADLGRRENINSDAYDLLLRGLRPLRTFTKDGISEARDYFQRAIEVDPDYARLACALA